MLSLDRGRKRDEPFQEKRLHNTRSYKLHREPGTELAVRILAKQVAILLVALTELASGRFVGVYHSSVARSEQT